MKMIGFRDSEADLAVIDDVCRELTEKGLTPLQAQVEVVSQMATQALQQGADQKEVMDALFHLSSNHVSQPEQREPVRRIRSVMTKEQVDELHRQMNMYRDLLLYWDTILCGEIQRYAFRILNQMQDKNLYRHELKRYANKLLEEARKLQMRIKDNDKAMVIKWCLRTDKRRAFAAQFFEDGGSIVSKFAMAYQKEFKTEWSVVWKDCEVVSKRVNTAHPDIVCQLLALEALTNTGVELYDACVIRMKKIMTGKGTFNIRKSLHHESMRNAVHNLISRLMKGGIDHSDVQSRYAREHLAAMQTKMIEKGRGQFFQEQFDLLTKEFTHYMIAWMRMELASGKMSVASIRTLHDRLGTRHRLEKFFKQLSEQAAPEDDFDIWEVMDSIPIVCDKSEIYRFFSMCEKDERHESPESQAKQEARLLRQQVRKNKGMLPDDILRVMAMHFKTKKALVEHLSTLGFELKPTLQRVKKMKASELKQL